jgi:membrane associated rhomboid family serine protease
MSSLPTCYRHPDRETGLSCYECGRPICAECANPSPVGIRCPDHAGAKKRIAAPRIVRRPTTSMSAAPVTRILIAVNVAIYLITAVQGAGLNTPGGALFDKFILYGPYVAQGDWWRLVTNMFLHGFLLHLGFNMFALWAIGRPVEAYLGSLRFSLLYFVSGLAGSAGHLVWSPHYPAVGASGAIFGVLGAMLILEWHATGKLAGNAMTWIAINLGFNFLYNGSGGNISIGAHIGGLIGGILITLAFANWGRGHAAYGKVGLLGATGLIGVTVASIVISYWKVRGFG